MDLLFANTVDTIDKKTATILIVIVVCVFALFAAFGTLIKLAMKYQAKRVDAYMANVYKASVVTDISSFRKFAYKKNLRVFYKQTLIPFAITFVGLLTWIIVCWATNDWSQNIFLNTKDILFIWDFGNPDYYNYFFGIKLLSSFPALINSPHIVTEHITSYIETILICTGILWYLLSCQCFLSRSVYIYFKSKDIFTTSLEDIKKAKEAAQAASIPTPPSGPVD